MRLSTAATISAVLISGALLGCGGGPPPAGGAVGEVTLHVTGGFTGWDRTLVVGADGELTYTVLRGPTPPAAPATRMDAQTLARLHALVSDKAFARLEAEYSPPPGGADLQRYAITAHAGAKRWRRRPGTVPTRPRSCMTCSTSSPGRSPGRRPDRET
jgi:hypothetical protein